MRYVLTFLVIACACFFSCGRLDCLTPAIRGVSFYGPFGAARTADTAVMLTQCKKGTDFTVVTNTTTIPADTLLYQNNVAGFTFPNLSDNSYSLAYNFDYIITLLPSGKVYHLKNVVSHASSIKHSGEVKENCINQVTYSANDSDYTNSSLPTNTSVASTMLEIKY
ncbi:MAG: hypothetical protein JWQ38_3678 [Flavipsychrobacter sp.]|nr:hypothetical protein [Flavipsychrobacter sp.]